MLTSSDVPAQVLYTLQCISWIFRQSEDIGWQTSFNKGEVSKTNCFGNQMLPKHFPAKKTNLRGRFPSIMNVLKIWVTRTLGKTRWRLLVR